MLAKPLHEHLRCARPMERAENSQSAKNISGIVEKNLLPSTRKWWNFHCDFRGVYDLTPGLSCSSSITAIAASKSKQSKHVLGLLMNNPKFGTGQLIWCHPCSSTHFLRLMQFVFHSEGIKHPKFVHWAWKAIGFQHGWSKKPHQDVPPEWDCTNSWFSG